MGDIVEGWLKITGKNIETKWSERFFYQPETDASCWVKFDLQGQQEYNEVLSQQFNEPGFSSTHQHATLTPGDLIYVELEEDNKTVKNIAATKVPRLRYRTPIGKLLRPDHLHRCKNLDTLCPACRVFGWVRESGKRLEPDRPTAYAGRVRFSHGTLIRNNGELPETTLAILSTPTPTTTSFYLLNAAGEPDPTVKYDTADTRLRGRKFYRHHGGMLSEQEYQRPGDIKDDQNRTVSGALKPGAAFTFTLDFENLAVLELGALLYALELEEGLYHRLGYAKPLGFGSVKVTVTKVHIVDWNARLSTLDPAAGWQELENWAEYKTKFLQEMRNLYGENYENIVLADLKALLGEPPNLPIHYPRSQEAPDPEGKNYEWFVGNNRRIVKRDLPAPCALPLATEERAGKGLLLIDKNGRGGSCQ